MFQRQTEKVANASSFKTITEYAPVYTTWRGRVYEKLLVRSAIEKASTLASKLKPEILGDPSARMMRALDTAPNAFMSWPELIGRCMTILLNDNNVAIVPSLDSSMNITGIFPLKFDTAEMVEYGGEPWMRFYVDSGDTMAIELKYVCLITRFQYESDFFGDDNSPLVSTLQLMDYQDQAQEQAIKNGARIQFIAASSSSMRPEDIRKKREQFAEDNLSEKNKTGLMLYDNTFDSMKQIEPMSYTISTDEMERIEANVFYYFGTNKDILQSTYSEEQFGAYYESEIEPFAVKLGEGLTQMLWTPTQRRHGCGIQFSANRLEYASNASKRNMIRDMMDRCVMTVNEARQVLQLPPLDGDRGDVFLARGEYYMLDKDLNLIYSSGGIVSKDRGERAVHELEDNPNETDFDLGGDDQEYADNDTRGKLEVDSD